MNLLNATRRFNYVVEYQPEVNGYWVRMGTIEPVGGRVLMPPPL